MMFVMVIYGWFCSGIDTRYGDRLHSILTSFRYIFTIMHYYASAVTFSDYILLLTILLTGYWGYTHWYIILWWLILGDWYYCLNFISCRTATIACHVMAVIFRSRFCWVWLAEFQRCSISSVHNAIIIDVTKLNTSVPTAPCTLLPFKLLLLHLAMNGGIRIHVPTTYYVFITSVAYYTIFDLEPSSCSDLTPCEVIFIINFDRDNRVAFSLCPSTVWFISFCTFTMF